MSKRNRRTPEQIIAATAEKLNAMQQKQSRLQSLTLLLSLFWMHSLLSRRKSEKPRKVWDQVHSLLRTG